MENKRLELEIRFQCGSAEAVKWASFNVFWPQFVK